MKTPRDVTGREAVKALRRLGFSVERQTGSHIIMQHGPKTVVVPDHKPIRVGTPKGLIEQAGVSMDEFINNL